MVGSASESSPGEDSALKTVSYGGGIVTFRIPVHWFEEHAPEGGGTFYDDAPNSGTLRLDVITARAPFPVSLTSAPDVLSSLGLAVNPVEKLPNGCALVRRTESPVDRGNRLFITYWSVAHVLPPYHARVATFSYTLLEEQRDEAVFRRELELLDREVRASVFSPELGEV